MRRLVVQYSRGSIIFLWWSFSDKGAYDARILLARIAGIEEERAKQLPNADNIDEILKSLQLAESPR